MLVPNVKIDSTVLREIRPDLIVKLSNLKSLYYDQCDGLWDLSALLKIYPALETLSLSELFSHTFLKMLQYI